MFEFTNIDFTDQRRNILVVFITRLGFSDRDLIQDGWAYFHYFELSDVTAKFMQALGCPR
ncbi:Uncharacterised protein [Vibrio cholerae]|nr:Uncharacterised protein [Vibrio cholerae]CSH82443.1 Uncharacterised protein [Vibrio cholerae]